MNTRIFEYNGSVKLKLTAEAEHIHALQLPILVLNREVSASRKEYERHIGIVFTALSGALKIRAFTAAIPVLVRAVNRTIEEGIAPIRGSVLFLF